MEATNLLKILFFEENQFNNNSEWGISSIVLRDPSEAYPFMRNASLSQKIGLLLTSLIFTSMAVFLKSIIFGYLLSPTENYKIINLMIFCQQFCRLITIAYHFTFGITYLLPFSLEDVFGGNFCVYFSTVNAFGMFGDIYWSSMLAFTRIMYVKCHTWLR